MKNQTKTTNSNRFRRVEPYCVVGSGEIGATIWKDKNAGVDSAYAVTLFRLGDSPASPARPYEVAELFDLLSVVRLLSFEIATDGCVESGLRDDLLTLSGYLDAIRYGGVGDTAPVQLEPPVGRSLRAVLEYLMEEERAHFAEHGGDHIYRHAALLDSWLNGGGLVGDGLTAESDRVGYYGGCPICATHDGYFRLAGEAWFVCVRHQVRWRAPGHLNLDHAERLDGELGERAREYRVVEPIRPQSRLARPSVS